MHIETLGEAVAAYRLPAGAEKEMINVNLGTDYEPALKSGLGLLPER